MHEVPVEDESEWFVIRKRDTEPIELHPFRSELEANAFYDLAAAQWSETFIVRVVRGPKVLPPLLSDQVLVDAVNSGALPLLETKPLDRDVHGGERIYPCVKCGVMRSKAEGGTVFTVCDECWDAGHLKEGRADE